MSMNDEGAPHTPIFIRLGTCSTILTAHTHLLFSLYFIFMSFSFVWQRHEKHGFSVAFEV